MRSSPPAASSAKEAGNSAAKVVPTLCISGQKCFEGEVPDLDQLHAALLHAVRNRRQLVDYEAM